MTPEEYYAHALSTADAEQRLPVPDQAGWDIFPFEAESLVVKRLEPPVLPEPPRNGEGDKPCWRCANPEENVAWGNERWVLVRMEQPPGVPFIAMLMPREHLDLGDLSDDMAAELGVLSVRLERAIRGLGGISRVHLYRFGDGGAHLHVFLIARPAGLLQLRGSNLPLWDDLLPPMPEDVYAADVAAVAKAMTA
jgi:diadenosine tetraphosphate (Ap4A) HIT family hydrolase